MIKITNSDKNENNNLDMYRLELLELVTEEDSIYPWNPTEEAAQDYFTHWESIDISDTDTQADNFFGYLENCWDSLDDARLEMSLRERFGNLIPKEWYHAIASQAQEIISQELKGIEELVKCVQPLLNSWGEDDLQVFARPLVYATRNRKPSSRKEINWNNLSEVKKARLTVEIAHYALTELKKEI